MTIIAMIEGLEENGGNGVQEAYQRPEAADHILLSKLSQDGAHTCVLGEFSSAEAAPSGIGMG